MGRLVDADELHMYFLNKVFTQKNWAYYEIEDAIDSAPTVDAEPVRHGRWEKVGQQFFRKHYHNHMVTCSECHREGAIRWDYCPHCGAKMDEVEDDRQ